MIMHFANLGEVYYNIVKRNDVTTAQETYQDVKQLPIRFEDRIRDQMVYKIGDVKTTYRMSYADAFAVTQAFLSNAELITTDHKEYEPLEKAGVVKIKWLRWTQMKAMLKDTLYCPKRGELLEWWSYAAQKQEFMRG